MVRVLANGSEDRSWFSSQVKPKTQKMLLYTPLLNTKQYKVRVKGRWSNPEKGVAPFQYIGVVAFEKGAFG